MHLEPAKIAFEIGGAGAELFAHEVGLILTGTFAIFLGEGKGFEIASIGDGLRVEGGVVWQFGNGDLGQLLPHQVALEGVVVDEDQRVEADVEPLCDRA